MINMHNRIVLHDSLFCFSRTCKTWKKYFRIAGEIPTEEGMTNHKNSVSLVRNPGYLIINSIYYDSKVCPASTGEGN